MHLKRHAKGCSILEVADGVGVTIQQAAHHIVLAIGVTVVLKLAVVGLFACSMCRECG